MKYQRIRGGANSCRHHRYGHNRWTHVHLVLADEKLVGTRWSGTTARIVIGTRTMAGFAAVARLFAYDPSAIAIEGVREEPQNADE